VKAFDRLLQSLSEIPKLLDEIPNGIDVAAERETLTNLTNTTIPLQKAHSHPTIETLEDNTKTLSVN